MSNYRLFLGLVFVLGTSQLTSPIHLSHAGIQETFSLIISNIILLSPWMTEVFYYNKYGNLRRIDTLSVITLMFVAGNLTLTFDTNMACLYAGHPTVVIFNQPFILAYAIVVLQYFLKGHILGFSRDIGFNTIACAIYGMSLLPLVLGLLETNIRTMLIHLIPSIFSVLTRRYHGSSCINFPHAVERAQLVTTLTLGETVIAVISTHPPTESLYQGVLLLVGTSFILTSYMTQTFLAIDHRRQAAGSSLFYAHIPIFIGISIFTVGIEFLAGSHHVSLEFAFFPFGFLSFYIDIATTTHYSQSIYQLHLKTYLKIGLLLGISAFIMSLARHHILLLSFVLCAIT